MSIPTHRNILEDSEDYLREFSQALATNNLELIKQKSHQLKGASSTIGALKINELSKEIENLTKHDELANLSSLLEKLPKLFDELSSILSSLNYGLSSSQPKP
ncbi:MAG: Hpt domain-containing protein [Synechococcaceae cyanobacterium RL_1_2]|nr:Hpt domain-containing protein [Synechococcaceae cyanobacterium RL_1_2]